MNNISLENIARFFAFFTPVALLIGRVPAEVCVILTSLLFLIHTVKSRDVTWLHQRWVQIALVTWVYLVGTSFFAVVNVDDALQRSLPFIRFILYAIALQAWLLKEPRMVKRALIILGAAVGFVIIDGTVQYITGTSLSGNIKPSPNRLSGPFSNWVVGKYISYFCLPVVGLLISFSINQSIKLKKYALPIIATIISILFVLLSGERMAFLLTAFCFGLFFLFAKGYRKPLFIAGLSSIALIGVAAISIPQTQYRMIEYTQSQVQEFTQSPYAMAFKRGLQTWGVQPITGVGLKNHRLVCIEKDFGSLFEHIKSCGTHPHNFYIEWLSETGVIGLLLFLSLIAVWTRHIILGLKGLAAEHYFMAVGTAVAMVSFLWPLASSQSFFSNWTGLHFWYALGLALSFGTARAIKPKPE